MIELEEGPTNTNPNTWTLKEINTYLEKRGYELPELLQLNYSASLGINNTNISPQTTKLDKTTITKISKKLQSRLNYTKKHLPQELRGTIYPIIFQSENKGSDLFKAENIILSYHHDKETNYSLPITSRVM